MKLRTVLFLASMPLLLGSVGLVRVHQAIAQPSQSNGQFQPQNNGQGQPPRNGQFRPQGNGQGQPPQGNGQGQPPQGNGQGQPPQGNGQGQPPQGNGQNGQPQRPPHPDFAAAASKLGITEAALKTALGVPAQPPQNGERPPRPNFQEAAAKLGITEDALIQALGVPPRPDGNCGGQFNGGQNGGDRPMGYQQQSNPQ